MIGVQTFVYGGLVNCAKVPLVSCCDQRWTFIDKRPCSLIFNIISRESPLGEKLPVRNVQGVLVRFVDEDNFSKWVGHSFVEGLLLRRYSNISMMHQSLNGEEKTRLAAVGLSNKARYHIFLFLLTVIQQFEKIFTKG